MRIHYVIIFFVFISCKTQKSQSEFDKCDFIVTENESDFDELVSNIDETIFYKNGIYNRKGAGSDFKKCTIYQLQNG